MNINKMMKQVQKAQEQMAAVQEELAAKTVEATAGGGMVKVVMSGDGNLRSLTIDPEVVDSEDVDMLQDLIVAAVMQPGSALVSMKPGETNLIKSSALLLPQTYPPKVPNDFANVPPWRSTSSSTPKCSGVPRPLAPSTPVPCASSTKSWALYLCFSSIRQFDFRTTAQYFLYIRGV